MSKRGARASRERGGRLAGFGLAAFVLLSPISGSAQDGASSAPDGMWVGGGVNAFAFEGGGAGGLRFELGLPIQEVGPGLLSVSFPLSMWHRGTDLCIPAPGGGFGGVECADVRRNALYLVPEVQWEYAFDLDIPQRFSVSGVGGAGFVLFWSKFDDVPGVGNDRESDFGIAFRMAGVARFGFANGAFVQMQPLGLVFHGRFDSDRGEDSFFVAYEWYAMGGYRWK